MKNTLFSSVPASRAIPSVANYVVRILRLKKRDLEAAEQVDMLAQKILAHGSDSLRNSDLDERMSPQLSIRNPEADMITGGQRGKKGLHSEVIPP